MIDTWRWFGVPFYLRTGKRLKTALTEIVVTLKKPLINLFPQDPSDHSGKPNQIILRVQPNAGITISFDSKAPGLEPATETGQLTFTLPQGDFGKHANGYERLILDCMFGDPKLFNSADMVEGGWRMIQPILEAWKSPPKEAFPNYATGSSGPDAADQLLASRGNAWHSLEVDS